MQAIVTKFIAPTDHRPSRIKATCQARSITLSWDHAASPAFNHRLAAQNLAMHQGWNGTWTAGGLPDGSTVWTLDTFTADRFYVAERDPCEAALPLAEMRR